MGSYETLTLSLHDGWAELRLNCPEKRNALSLQLLRDLANATQVLNDRQDIRIVLLEGAGQAFSVGFDLRTFADTFMANEGNLEQKLSEAPRLGARAVAAISQLQAITIASVHGYAIGGGFLLLAACDFRIVANDTIFSLPEVDIGIPLLWGGVPLLREHLGANLAKDLVLSARRFGVDDLKQNHFIYRTVAADRRKETHMALIEELKSKPAWVLKQTKRQFLAASKFINVDQDIEPELFSEAVMHPDFIPTAMAYMQRLRQKE